MKIVTQILWKLHIIYCWLLRPVTLGVKALVLDRDGRVLLVKHTYKTGWHLPGGAVDKGETSLASVKRELMEEAGIVCDVEPEARPSLFYSNSEFKHDHVILFVVREWSRDDSLRTAGEISDVGFFDPANLPLDTTPATRRRIREELGGERGVFEW